LGLSPSYFSPPGGFAHPTNHHFLWTGTRLLLPVIGFTGVVGRAQGEGVSTAALRFDKERADSRPDLFQFTND